MKLELVGLFLFMQGTVAVSYVMTGCKGERLFPASLRVCQSQTGI